MIPPWHPFKALYAWLLQIVNTKMFQDNSPQEIYGYCHLCFELKKFGVDYTDLYNWKRHVGSQCHPATEKPSDCDFCGEKFRSMRDHDRHYCTKVPKTTEGWTTYKLLEKESVAARTISKLNLKNSASNRNSVYQESIQASHLHSGTERATILRSTGILVGRNCMQTHYDSA